MTPSPPSSAPRDARRARLVQIVSERSLLRDTAVTLASGRSSSFYIDMKPTIFHPEGASLIADLMVDVLRDIPVDFVGGLEMGAVPLVACVAQRSFPARPIGGFFVRKQPKDHGTRRLVEGLGRTESLDGRDVVLLEDVTTTGGSVMKAVTAVRAEGGRVSHIITVLDRLEGAADNLAGDGLSLTPLLTANDFAV
jgi:orotate phosphoribosyltransferase